MSMSPAEEAIRSGAWTEAQRWTELASGSDGYQVVRRLWLDSPRRVHARAPILRAVALAAAGAGEFEEARTLLRRAIVREGQRSRRLGNRLRRLAHRVTGRPAGDSGVSPAPAAPADPAVYFDLLDAVMGGRRTEQRRLIFLLREQGEGDWLTRI